MGPTISQADGLNFFWIKGITIGLYEDLHSPAFVVLPDEMMEASPPGQATTIVYYVGNKVCKEKSRRKETTVASN